MICIDDGLCFKCWIMHLHEKVEIGVLFWTHVAVEEVDVFLIYFFYAIWYDAADFLLEFFVLHLY